MSTLGCSLRILKHVQLMAGVLLLESKRSGSLPPCPLQNTAASQLFRAAALLFAFRTLPLYMLYVILRDVSFPENSELRQKKKVEM